MCLKFRNILNFEERVELRTGKRERGLDIRDLRELEVNPNLRKCVTKSESYENYIVVA